MISLPCTKAPCSSETSMGRMGFMRLTNNLAIILYELLHKLIYNPSHFWDQNHEGGLPTTPATGQTRQNHWWLQRPHASPHETFLGAKATLRQWEVASSSIPVRKNGEFPVVKHIVLNQMRKAKADWLPVVETKDVSLNPPVAQQG